MISYETFNQKKAPDPPSSCSVWLEWKAADFQLSMAQDACSCLDIPSGSMSWKACHIPWFGLSMIPGETVKPERHEERYGPDGR